MTENHGKTRVAVIMAGGSGERFWPLSRVQRPKQLLRLTHPDETLLQEAVTRISPLVPAEHVFIATGRVIRDVVRAGDGRLAPGNVLAEPCKRNTAGALVWTVANLLARYPGEDPAMAVLTADHLIGDPDRFRSRVDQALAAAEEHDALVTFGVAPTRAETGYGYIEAGDAADGSAELYNVRSFREKPAQELADEFVAKGNFYWNSGMFFWRPSVFLRELESARPGMAKATREIAAALASGDEARAETLFEGLENVSIDYALLEQATSVLMVPGDFPWDDVGAWDSLDRTRAGDDHGNVAVGNPVLVDCHDTIVYNEPGAGEIAVGVVGMRDVIVVVSPDGVLVAPKDRAQDVKQVVQELKARGASQL